MVKLTKYLKDIVVSGFVSRNYGSNPSQDSMTSFGIAMTGWRKACNRICLYTVCTRGGVLMKLQSAAGLMLSYLTID